MSDPEQTTSSHDTSAQHEMSPTLNQNGIRRSKRSKKFQLDFVAAAHGENQKKSKRDFGDSDEEPMDEDEAVDYEKQLNVTVNGEEEEMDQIPEAPEEEEQLGRGRRSRRRTAGVMHSYQQEQPEHIENFGPHFCTKCPVRYVSRSSLANHSKMHNGGVLKFACELCDFSATTIKSLNAHVVIHQQYGVLSPQISPSAGAGAQVPGPSPGAAASEAGDEGPTSTSSDTDDDARKAAGAEANTSNTSLTGAPQLAVAAEDIEAPQLERLEDEESEDEDDGPPVLEREVPESPEPNESSVRKSGRAPKPTAKVLEKKTRGPYKKKNKSLPLVVDSDGGVTSSESGQNSPVLAGSMPTSSSASSVTPPPAKENSKKKAQPATPPASRETSEEKEVDKKGKKGRVKCKNCPYSCSSPSRLARHMQGHLLREGYMCPVDGCYFMCRKQGFIAKHFILHGKKLPSVPKYCRKAPRGARWLIEECEDPMMVSLNLTGTEGKEGEDPEEEEEEEETMLDSTTDSGDSKEKEEPEEDVKPSTSSLKAKKEPKPEPKPEKKPAQKRKLEKTPEPTKKTKAQIPKSPTFSPVARRPVSQAELRAQAQIKSHKKLNINGHHYKQCNVGDCTYRTWTVSQIIAHKIHSHGAMDSFPLHQHLCFFCGYRTLTFQQMRAHKLKSHPTHRRRFHRTFYLKEIVGDKFYIRHYTVGRPIVAAALVEPTLTPTKPEAPPTLIAEITVAPTPTPEPPKIATPPPLEPVEGAAESMDVKPAMLLGNVKQEALEEMEEKMMMEEDEEEDDDDDGDRSFDSNPGSSAQMPPEILEAMVANRIIFCCNYCPYKSPTANRTERHHAKHFVANTHRCPKCTWSCRSKQVMAAHGRMHEQFEKEEEERAAQEEEKPAEGGAPTMIKMEQLEPEIEERMAPEDEVIEEEEEEEDPVEPPKLQAEQPSEDVAEFEENPFTKTSLFASIQSWCLKEKAKRPELDEQFTRKMIDTIKGFQCSDCPYTSKYRGDMRSHKKRHDIEQSFRCVQCTYTTNRPVSLKDHLKQHGIVNRALIAEGTNAQPLRTSEGAHFGTRYGVGKDRIYVCLHCPYVSISIGCLWRHYRNHRDPPRVNVCSNCTYSSIDSRKMDEHLLIHLSLGAHLNEQIPFVKRVDYQGRPVTSLMDTCVDGKAQKTPTTKRKLEKTEEVEEVLEESEEEEEEELEIQPKPKRNQRIQKIKEEDKEFRPSSSGSPPKRRKMSTEPSPEPEASSSSQPTRQPSERATRNRINYSLLSRNGSGKPTPSSSSANLEAMVAAEVQEQENELARQAAEPDAISHWRIRSLLNKEFGANAPTQCPECPYKTSDPEVLEKHRYYHTPKANGLRPYVCSDCSFNTYTPTALLQHLKLHSDGFVSDTTMKHQRLQKHQKKGDVIPAGAEGLYCRNCPYKTANKRAFQEHVAYHRHLLINRMLVSLKRQPPKEEYQRPKLKHQFVAKNAKYCKKCTFKCVSHSAFIEHLDRHGWNQLYKCHICDYSDMNRSVVDFHQLTHHIVRDQTLHGINQSSKYRLENGKIQKPETAKVAPTPEDFVMKTRGLIKCSFCEYFCHISSEMAFHMTVNHLNEPNAEETISHLSMGLIPPQATVTTV